VEDPQVVVSDSSVWMNAFVMVDICVCICMIRYVFIY
jgi:hypothetical protein